MDYDYADDWNDWAKEQEAMDYEEAAEALGLSLPMSYCMADRVRSLTYQQPEA